MQKFFLFLYLIVHVSVLSGQEGSLLCLHGFLRSYKCLIPIGHAFRNEGIDVYLWDYRSRDKKIEEHAADLVEVLNAIAKKNPGQPIHFISHSLGGVIVRAAVSHPDCPLEAKNGKALLLAPPNKGSCLARHFRNFGPAHWIFGTKAGKQLLTYSEEDMKNLGTFPDTMQVTILAGTKKSRITNKWMNNAPNDGKVTVEETRLDTPHYHYVNHVSHNWIMTSRQTIRLAKKFILSDSSD